MHCYVNHNTTVCPTGHPSSGQDPPHESDEGGPSIAALHCEQCEDPGCNKVQGEYSG